MAQNNSKLPLSVKVPIYLAALIATVTLSVIFFESFPGKEIKIKSCKVLQTGRLKSANVELGLVTHLFRNSDGEYRLAGLQKENTEWGLYRFNLLDGQMPALEPISTKSNEMENIGHFNYSLKTTLDNQSIIITNTGKIFPAVIKSDVIALQNALSYCGHDWSENSDIKYLDGKTLIATNNAGAVALYQNTRFGDLIPRGAGATPTALFSIIAGNRLEYTDCTKLQKNLKARLRTDHGVFAINSGENSTLAIYKILNENFQLQSTELTSKFSSFSDFRIFESSFVFFKRGSWLQKNSEWIFSDDKSIATKDEPDFEIAWEPLAMRDDYTPQGEKKNNSYWLLQKEGFFFSEIILSHIIDGKVTERFKIADSKVSRIAASGGIWIVLPSGRHMFFGNQAAPGQFAVTDCN